MTNNYVVIYQTANDKRPQIHPFDDKNKLARTRALGLAQCAARAIVWRRPSPQWDAIAQVYEGPQWTDEERAIAEGGR